MLRRAGQAGRGVIELAYSLVHCHTFDLSFNFGPFNWVLTIADRVMSSGLRVLY